MVQSIQPLVNLIRSSPESTPAEEQQIYTFIQDISLAVDDTGDRTYEAVKKLNDPALEKHTIPVVQILDDCRRDMLDIDIRNGGRDQIPPLAFKTARALKVCTKIQIFKRISILTIRRSLSFASTASNPAN